MQEFFEGLGCLYLNQMEHLYPVCLKSEDGYPHNAQYPIIKAHAVRHPLFLAQRMLSYCSLIFFWCQTYAVIILKPFLFETLKEYSSLCSEAHSVQTRPSDTCPQ